MTLEFWIFMPLLLVSGYQLGRWHNRRWRRDRFAAFGRKLQLIAARNEMKGYRHKRKRPMLKRWQKFLLGWLHNITPTFTRYTNFKPETLVGWHRRFVKRWWWMLVVAGKRRAAGRPRIDASVEKIIIAIKADNPSYGTKRISFLVTQTQGNTARPHRANDGQSPIQEVNAANDVTFTPGTLRVEAIPWLGGLHHSYRRAA